MGCVECRIQKEGLLRLQGLVQELQSEIDICVGGVERASIQGRGHLPRLAVQSKRLIASKEIGGSRQMPPIALKAEICGLLVEMPFSHHRGEVPRPAQYFGNRRTA